VKTCDISVEELKLAAVPGIGHRGWRSTMGVVLVSIFICTYAASHAAEKTCRYNVKDAKLGITCSRLPVDSYTRIVP
jgi:hypothetical protein